MRSYRSLKIADAIRNELLIMFQDGSFENPQFSDVSISHVELSKDNANVKVFFTLVDDSQSKEVEKALNNAASYVRTLLAQSLNLGYTPAVRFQFDHVALAGNKLDELLQKISQKNESV
jgi:ribosome-binding factor A